MHSKINLDIHPENNTKVIMNELGDIFTALPSKCICWAVCRIWVYQMPWTFGLGCTRKRRQENKRETVESPPHVTFWWKTTFGIDKNSLLSPQEQELTQRNQITQLARHRIISNWKNCIQYHWNSIMANFEKVFHFDGKKIMTWQLTFKGKIVFRLLKRHLISSFINHKNVAKYVAVRTKLRRKHIHLPRFPKNTFFAQMFF